jgi:hypothetical protein
MEVVYSEPRLFTLIHVSLTSLSHIQHLLLHFVSSVTAAWGINLIQTLIMFMAEPLRTITTQNSLAFFQNFLYCFHNSMKQAPRKPNPSSQTRSQVFVSICFSIIADASRWWIFSGGGLSKLPHD